MIYPLEKNPLIEFVSSFLLCFPAGHITFIAADLSPSHMTPSVTHKFPQTLLTQGYYGYLALFWSLGL